MLAQVNQKEQYNQKVLILEKLLHLYYFTELKQIWLYLISAIGEFQYITFLWVPISLSGKLTFFQKQINYHSFMMYFCRFDEIINLQFQQSRYYFLIPLVIQIVFYILPFLLIILFKKNQKLLQLTFIKIYLTLSSILSQIFIVYLFLPMSMFAISSFATELKSDQNITNLILCFLSMLITVVILLNHLLLCRETVDLQDNKFQKFNQTILDHFNIFLSILQILIYQIVTQQVNGQTLQSVIVLAISFIKIVTLFQFEYLDQTIIYINLIISSYGVTASIAELISNLNTSYGKEITDTIILLVFPCLSRTIISVFNQREKQFLNGILQNKHYNVIKYYLSKFIYNKMLKEDKRMSDSIIMNWLNKFQDHQTNDSVESNNKNKNNTKNNQCLDLFIQKKLKQFVKSVQKHKGYDLHYVQLLNKFGFSNLALMQLNQLISKQLNQIKSKGFLVDNGLQDSAADSSQRYTAHQSVSSKSARSNTDEIIDIAQRNQVKRNKLIIIGKNSLSSIEIAKAQIIKEQIKIQVQKNFFENNSAKQYLTDMKLGVELFLRNEKRNSSLRSTIIYIMNEKVKFFQQFTSKKSIEADQLYKQASQLSDIQLNLENKLFERYQQFPSQKIQSILIFYQGEILNNYIEAYKYRGLTSMPDEQLINMDMNIKSAFFSKKIVYLNLLLEYNQNLLITNKSENALKFFQITNEDAKSFNCVEQILPLAIKNEHNLLVQRFTSNSKSKFYLNSSQTFFKLNNLLVKPCSLLFDIHFDNINHYKFSAFFSEYANQSAYIMVDINHIVGGITESFFEKLGLNDEFIKLFNQQENKKLNIEMLIPNFKKYAELKQTNALTELRFIKYANLANQDKSQIQSRQQSLTSTNWSCIDSLYLYEAEINIQYQELYGYYYYIIEVIDAKLQCKSNKSLANTIKSNKPQGIEDFFEITELSEIEAIANTPKISRLQKINKIQYNENYVISIEDRGLQIEKNKAEIEFQNLQELSFHQINILSPNISNAPWNDSSQLPLQNSNKFVQQDYFQKDHEQSMSAYQSKNNLEEIEEEKSRNFNNKIMAKQKQLIQEEQDQSSSKNAFKGIKQSQFYKKYESISQLIEPRTPNSLKLFILFSQLTYIVSLTYFIVILFNTQVDLNRFIGEIDMIQLHAGIMNPHDLYLQIRQTIITYNSFLTAGKINQTELKMLTDPLYENVGIGYYEFKEGFIYWLGNEYLTPFLKDQNITAYYMLNGSTTYPIVQNIRETLMATLSYYYAFKLRFEARLSTANQTYQVYQFANIYNFHDWLEKLTMEVYQYSKSRSVDISNKWTIIWILYLMVNLCPLIASLYYYRYCNAKFDQFINLFKYCSSQKMEIEIERFKYLLKLLSKNQDLLLNYTFDIETKEDDIQKSRISFDQQKVKDIKIQQSFKRLSFALKFILLVLGWLVFLGLSIVSNILIEQYLSKYTATADAYKLIQDMSLYAGTLYRNRDFGLAFPNYPYLRDFDKEMFYDTIKTGLETISTFLKFSYTYDSSNYQTSEEFFQFFKSLQEQNICMVLGDDVLGFLKQYCEKSLQGTLLLGLFPTLKFIQTSIQTQQQMNNFTKRVEYNKYENEGSLIVLRSFQLMSKQFKIGMVNVTEQQIMISNSISIIYIIYSTLVMIFFAFYLLQKMRHQLQLAKRFILLIPSTVLFLDDQFDRHVRILIAGQEY